MNTAPATRAELAAPPLSLEARLAIVGAVMDERCTLAVLAVEVNIAHIPSAEPVPAITLPPPTIPASAPCPYSTPVAAVLHRARVRLEVGGWCTGQLRDEQGAACPIGSIRVEASSRGEADDACAVLLQAIRRDFADAETIPSWNDGQRNPRLPLLYLDRAAALAHARGL